jgi:sarcosine oxidase subunit delta
MVRHGAGSSDEDYEAYMFARKNPKGVHFERWRHAHGCGKWFLAARDTATLEVFGTYPAQTKEPPADLVAAIKAKRPGWEGYK